jgi:phosphoketolase
MTLGPVYDAAAKLAEQGIGSRIVSVINPRRLYRPTDIAWNTVSEQDGDFLSDADFAAMFSGDALIGVTGGTSGMLEPIMLRSTSPRDLFAWKRGETTATAGQLFAFNGMTVDAIADRAKALLG